MSSPSFVSKRQKCSKFEEGNTVTVGGGDVSIATCLISKCSPLSALWHWGSCNQFYKWPGFICASCSNSYWAFYGRAAFQVFNPHSDSLSKSVIIPVYR